MRDEWVRVESVDEVSAGTALRWSDVGPEIAIVLRVREPATCVDCGDTSRGVELSDDPLWYRDEDETNCLLCDITRSVLYRLVLDDDTAADETATTKRKERVQ